MLTMVDKCSLKDKLRRKYLCMGERISWRGIRVGRHHRGGTEVICSCMEGMPIKPLNFDRRIFAWLRAASPRFGDRQHAVVSLTTGSDIQNRSRIKIPIVKLKVGAGGGTTCLPLHINVHMLKQQDFNLVRSPHKNQRCTDNLG